MWKFIISFLTMLGLIKTATRKAGHMSPADRIEYVKSILGPGPIKCGHCGIAVSETVYKKKTFTKIKTATLLAICLIFLLVLSGCEPSPDGKPWSVNERCIKGVVYYVNGYKLAPAFKQDGSLYTCEN